MKNQRTDAHPPLIPLLVGALPPPITGQTICFELLLRGLKQRRIPYDFVNMGESKFERFIGRFSLKRAMRMLLLISRFARLAARKRRAVYLTIAQSKVGFLRDFCIIWWAWAWRHRIILHLKGGGFGRFYQGLPRWQKWIVRNTWRRASVIIVLGESLRSMLSFDTVLSSKLKVIANPLPEKDDELPLAGKTLPQNRRARVLYLSNLVKSKGYLLVLEAVRVLVKERGFSVEAHFCGEFVPEQGSDFREAVNLMKREFLELVEAGGLVENIHYHGAVSGEKKRAMLRQSDFFVLPTQYPNEGQPISIIEAMAYGLVVLATPIASIPDMIDDGVDGLIVPPEPKAIADTLEQLIRSKEEFSAISSGAIRKYQRAFTLEAHLNAIIPCILGSKDF